MTPPRTRIKFCGMTRAEDVRLAVDLGVDLIGLVFAARSPRRLAIAQAQALRVLVPPGIGVVALVMDTPRKDVEGVVAALRPDYLQFHGSEDAAHCASFGLPYFKAIAMGDGGDPLPAMAAFPSAYGYVLDGHGAGASTGTACHRRHPSRSCWPVACAPPTWRRPSAPRVPGAWTCPAASSPHPASRTPGRCAVSSPKCVRNKRGIR